MYGSTGDPLIKNPTSPITLDVSHEPSLAYLPFLLTGDPYALEEMQLYTTYNVIAQPPSARQNFNLGNAVRAVAWSLRALAQNATVTPDAVPTWLMPRSYFKTMLDQERDWFMTRWVNSTTPPASNLNLVSDGKGAPTAPPIPAECYVSIWMEDYLTAVLAFVVQCGHEEWRPVMEWKSRDVLSRTGDSCGWVRAVPTMYTMVIKQTTAGPVAVDWRAAWQFNEQIQPSVVKYTDADTIPAAINLTYPSYILGATAMLVHAGMPNAGDNYAWLLGQIQANTTTGNYIRRKWAIGIDG